MEPTTLAIGVHFGRVVAGLVGGGEKVEYKVTGDAVNVAARLESMAKDRGVGILSSADAVDAARMRSEVRESLGATSIRGRDSSIELVRIR